MDKKIISFRSPHLILAGIGALERLGQEANEIGAKKVLLVTDKGVIDSGIGKKIKDILEREGIGVNILIRLFPIQISPALKPALRWQRRVSTI